MRHRRDGQQATATYDQRFDALASLSYRVAFRMVGSREEARDIAQEAMARAYARWPKVEQAAPAWVSRVTANLALDLIRRRRPRSAAHRAADRGAFGTTGATFDLAPDAVQRTDLVSALRALPRRQRDVVVLRYLADLPEAEVATALGCSTGTVKQHASRGLAALRASVELSTPTAEHTLEGTP